MWHRYVATSNFMNKHILTQTLCLIIADLFLNLTPLSIKGYYTDTIVTFLTLVLILVAIIFEFIFHRRYLIVLYLGLLIIPVGKFLIDDISFKRYWDSPKVGTVEYVEISNAKNRYFKTTVYYQLNSSDRIGPEECHYVEKRVFRFFPIIDWTIDDEFNCCGDIKELN